MYIQTEFCLDLSQGDTASLPSWMKPCSDRALPKPIIATQLTLFDINQYAST